MRTYLSYLVVTFSLVVFLSNPLPACVAGWEVMDTKGSSSIASAKYRKGTVAIRFTGNRDKVYEHKGVSRLTWENWKKASSKGRFYRMEFQRARLEEEQMRRAMALKKITTGK